MPMFRRAVVALVAGAVAASVSAADPVTVKGSSATYLMSATVAVGDKTVKLNLTGVALRKRLGAGVYAIGSYVQDGTAVRTAEDVVKADAVRLLHLVMERTVDSEDFVAAFRIAVGRIDPDDKFAPEFKQLTDAVGDRAAAKGDHVYLVSVPGVGVRIRLAEKVDVTIKNPAFARALWEIYLGENPIDDGIKNGLVGLLSPR
jgi:hypothetical protein